MAQTKDHKSKPSQVSNTEKQDEMPARRKSIANVGNQNGGAMAKGHGRSKTDCCCIDKFVNVETKSAELFRRHHFSGIGKKWSDIRSQGLLGRAFDSRDSLAGHSIPGTPRRVIRSWGLLANSAARHPCPRSIWHIQPWAIHRRAMLGARNQ